MKKLIVFWDHLVISGMVAAMFMWVMSLAAGWSSWLLLLIPLALGYSFVREIYYRVGEEARQVKHYHDMDYDIRGSHGGRPYRIISYYGADPQKFVAIGEDGRVLGTAVEVYGAELPEMIQSGTRLRYQPHGLLARISKAWRNHQDLKWSSALPYDRKLGGGLLCGVDQYNLLSHDHVHWAAFDQQGNALGEAEAVYPGLLARLAGIDRMTQYRRQNGPIDPRTDEGRAVLEGAGFTVS